LDYIVNEPMIKHLTLMQKY